MEQEKQTKVQTGIKNNIDPGQDVSNMKAVRKKPNDECYTGMQDILNELAYWGDLGKFKDKKIICPCDWDISKDGDVYSITIEYKPEPVRTTINNVYRCVKYVKLGICSDDSTQPSGHITTNIELDDEDKIEKFLREKLNCNFLKTFMQKAKVWGIKSITASGYDPDSKKGISFQEVDYKQYDVCCTNPPFSLYGEFMECLLTSGIDFIVLAPFLNRVTPNIGLPLMRKDIYLGTSGDTNCGYLAMDFKNRIAEDNYESKKVACDWITTFSEAQDERNARLHGHKTGIEWKTYKDEYLVMPNMIMRDNTHPIRVPADGIPDDFYGWMFTTVNVLTKIDLSEFEWYGTNFKKYYNKTNKGMNPFNHDASDTMLYVNGKNAFHGVIIRRLNRPADYITPDEIKVAEETKEDENNLW